VLNINKKAQTTSTIRILHRPRISTSSGLIITN